MRLNKSKQISFFEIERDGNDYSEICKRISNEDRLSPDDFGIKIRHWSEKNIIDPPNIVALFSGAGGLDIGFCDVGYSLMESVEIEQKFVQTMIFNQAEGKYFKGANILCKDIREYKPAFSQKVDFIIGGPPCQSFSAAGRRAAGVAGTKDERGSLFEEYVRIVKSLKPKGFLFENVYGLLGAEKGQAINKIVLAFEEIGYHLSYRILDAADYGVPQHRERLIIVGSAGKKFQFPKPLLGPDSQNNFPHLTAVEALSNVPVGINEKLPSVNGRFGHLLGEIPPGLNYSFFTERMGHPNPIFAWRSKFSDFLYKADPQKPVRTLKASGGQYTGPFHWENRHFSIQELKRLQTFPDDYNIVGNRGVASKQIGNSVPPQFARILGLAVLEQFFGVTLPIKLKYLAENEKLSFRTLKGERTEQYSQKAESALVDSPISEKSKVKSKTYSFELSPSFGLIKSSNISKLIAFKQKKDVWTFTLAQVAKNDSAEAYRVEIINTRGLALFPGVKKVVLISQSTSLSDYSLMWKIFERALIENNIKADLVQLNGYYQYVSNMSYSMIRPKQDVNDIWNLIELILIDPNISKIRHISELSLAYDIEAKYLKEYFLELRKVGFEIRNHNTNNEIPEEHFLIPYRFPTLTPLSVQLSKSL